MAKYQALANISVPRVNDTTNQNDLVESGNTVELTDEVAAHLTGECSDAAHRIRRRTPMIRKIADAKNPQPLILPRMMSTSARRPPSNPPAGYDGPRADPAGSSLLLTQEVPEGTPPATDEDQGLGGDVDPDALDLPPRRARASAGAGTR